MLCSRPPNIRFSYFKVASLSQVSHKRHSGDLCRSNYINYIRPNFCGKHLFTEYICTANEGI